MKVYCLLILALVATACQKKPEGFEIKAHIENLSDGTKVYLSRYEGLNLAVIDSAVSSNGKLHFTGSTPDTTLAVLSIEGFNTGIPLFLENAALQIHGHIDSLYQTRITGSQTNEEFIRARNHINGLNQYANEVFMQSRNVSPEDSLEINQLQKTYDSIQKSIKTFSSDYIREHSKSYVSLFLVFDLFSSIEEEQLPNISEMYYSLHPAVQNSPLGKGFLEQLARMTPLQQGDPAPDFVAPLVNNDAFKLSNLEAKLVILDFWASWCTPCRAENPLLVKLYDEFHKQGLDIVSISLDNNRSLWEKAIAKDGIGNWHHVSNLMFWAEPVAADYGVLAIPQNFVLDADKKILAVGIRGKQLEDFIRKKMAEN